MGWNKLSIKLYHNQIYYYSSCNAMKTLKIGYLTKQQEEEYYNLIMHYTIPNK